MMYDAWAQTASQSIKSQGIRKLQLRSIKVRWRKAEIGLNQVETSVECEEDTKIPQDE